jgi:hypothetical protein
MKRTIDRLEGGTPEPTDLARLSQTEFGTLRSANELLGDQPALDRRYRQEGVLLLGGVLGPDTLRPIRDQAGAVLMRWGVAERVGEDLMWTGEPVPEIDDRELHDLPALNALANDLRPLELLCDTVYGRRTSVTRRLGLIFTVADDPAFTTPPHQDFLIGEHGVDFRRLWLPLTTVPFGDAGLGVAVGSHTDGGKPGGPVTGYKQRRVKGRRPLDQSGTLLCEMSEPWVTSSFELGDVLMFHRHLVHAGIPPASDRVRISLQTIVSLEGEKHHYHWTYPETHDYLQIVLKIATALGASEAEAHRVHGRLESNGNVAPDEESVRAALAAHRADERKGEL